MSPWSTQNSKLLNCEGVNIRAGGNPDLMLAAVAANGPSIWKVLAYTACLDQDQFLRDGLIYDATLRNLELIGEAMTHVLEAVRAANPQVPWRLIVATRNRLIHGYLGIDGDTLWSIVQGDIPALLPRSTTAEG